MLLYALQKIGRRVGSVCGSPNFNDKLPHIFCAWQQYSNFIHPTPLVSHHQKASILTVETAKMIDDQVGLAELKDVGNMVRPEILYTNSTVR